MPLYTFRNTETDDYIEKIFTISERDSFLQENSTWVQVLSTPPLVRQVGSNISKTSDGWKDVLKTIKKGSGRGNTIKL